MSQNTTEMVVLLAGNRICTEDPVSPPRAVISYHRADCPSRQTYQHIPPRFVDKDSGPMLYRLLSRWFGSEWKTALDQFNQGCPGCPCDHDLGDSDETVTQVSHEQAS